jgi:hypothetical protein
VSCEREFSSLQGRVSFTLQPSSAFFLLCKREKIPLAKESRLHDTGQCLSSSYFLAHKGTHDITGLMPTYSHELDWGATSCIEESPTYFTIQSNISGFYLLDRRLLARLFNFWVGRVWMLVSYPK